MTKSNLPVKCPACGVLNPTHLTKCVKCERPIFDIDRPAASVVAAEASPELATMARVTVTDIQMPFWSMVVFMVKWAIATIPALLILIGIGFLAVFLFAAAGIGLTAAAEPSKRTVAPVPQTELHQMLDDLERRSR